MALYSDEDTVPLKLNEAALTKANEMFSNQYLTIVLASSRWTCW